MKSTLLSLFLCFLFLTPTQASQLWRLPDGSTIAEENLPGFLISDNDGVYGRFQKSTGMKISIDTKQNPDVLTDGELNKGIQFAPGKEAPQVIMEFPETSNIQEIDLQLQSFHPGQSLSFYKSADGKKWGKIRCFELPQSGKRFSRISLDCKNIRFLGICNSGNQRIGIHEIFVWGTSKYRPTNRQSGILPNMKEAIKRTISIPYTKQIPNKNNFDDALLKQYQMVEFFPIRKKETVKTTRAFLAMTPEGLSVIFANEIQKDKTLQQMEILINRNDLNMSQYYRFVISADGRIRTDSSRVIDPTKGGAAFNGKAYTVTKNDVHYSVVTLPLNVMTEDNNFKKYTWSICLFSQSRSGSKIEQLTYPAITALHAPAQFALIASLESGQLNKYCSFNGMDRTNFSQQTFDHWRQQPEVQNKKLIVVPTALENSTLVQPILPTENLNRPRKETMVRTEVENLIWFVINPMNQNQKIKLRFDGFQNQSGQQAQRLSISLGTVGVVELRTGPVLRPILMGNNMPGSQFLQKYIRNSVAIENFPDLTLAPGEAAAIVLRVRTENTTPGLYSGILDCGQTKIPITIDVADVSLPQPENIWNNGHSRSTLYFSAPIRGDQYAVNEAQYYYDSGINVVPLRPTDDVPGLKELQKKVPNMLYYFRAFGKYNKMLRLRQITQETFTPEMEADILDMTKKLRDELLAAGYDYSCWFLSLMDEPGVDETAWGYGKIAEIIKKFDPKIQIYCNPCCWKGGFSSDEEILKAYSPWYNQYVDISYPIGPLYFGWGTRDMKPLRQLWDAPRRFNGTYVHPCPGRIQPWQAFFADQNAWGYYSLFQPRRDPWNDFDLGSMDYQTVYPGVNGLIFTVDSEQSREAWEDYKMLCMLKVQKQTDAIEKLKESFKKPNTLDCTKELDGSPWRARRKLLLKTLCR